MKAAYLVSHGAPGAFELRDAQPAAPAADEVLVEVKACGLNRLDLWAEEGALPIPVALPRVLGGEIAGMVSKLGADVDDWRSGQRVAVQSNLFCGSCEYCLKGEESICVKGQLLGVHRDGGFQEFVSVPARALVPLPDEVEFTTAASMTLAGSTAMHMLTARAEVRSADWVLVIAGASGVGSYAIQIARQLGARVIATGSTAAKRDFATALGAEFVVDSSDERWAAKVREITQKRGVDLVVEHVGGKTLERAFDCLARGGTIVTCGATAGRQVQLNLWPFFVKQQRLIGSYGRSRADMIATLEWAAYGRIKPAVHQTFPLERIGEAFAALRGRATLGKVVLLP